MTRYYLPISLLCSAALLTACGDDDAPINEAVKGSISLAGTARVNETLSIENAFSDRNGVERIQPTYQWYGNGVAIPDATEATYVLTSGELDQDVHVVMDFLDDDGFPETLTSDSVNVFYPYTITMVLDDAANLVIKQSTDLGATWGATITPNPDHGDEIHYYPSIASDGLGNLIVVAVSESNPDYGGGSDIVFTRSSDNGASWSDIELLVSGANLESRSDGAPVIDTDKNGNWMIVWESLDDLDGSVGTDRDIHYSISTDNGLTWSDPGALNPWANTDTTEGDKSPQISMNGANWVVAWSSPFEPDNASNSDNEIYTMFSSNSGGDWSVPSKILIEGNENITSDAFPIMDVNEETGRGVLIWRGQENGDDVDVYVSTTTNANFGSSWGAGSALNDDADTDTTDSQDYASSVTILADGSIVAAWHGNSDGTGTDDEVYYEASGDNGATWSGTRILNPNPETDEATDSEISPLFIKKPDDEWIATWVNDNTREVYISNSADLLTWSASPEVLDETSEESIAWILH